MWKLWMSRFAEIKKGKYIYYSCTNAKGFCHRDYVNEKEFLKEISNYFNEMRLSREVIDEITQYLKKFMSLKGSFIKRKESA